MYYCRGRGGQNVGGRLGSRWFFPISMSSSSTYRIASLPYTAVTCIVECTCMYIFCMYRSVFCKMLLSRLPMTVKLTVVVHILVCCWASQEKYSGEMDSRNGSCPPWYYHDDEDKCSFSHQLPQIVNQYGNTSELEMGYCMTQTNYSLVVTGCSYIIHNFSQQHSIYQVLPKQLDQVNDSLCGTFNRKGFLCSECKENYGLAAYRYYGLMCVKCSDSAWNWVAYILLLFVPPTILLWFCLLST